MNQKKWCILTTFLACSIQASASQEVETSFYHDPYLSDQQQTSGSLVTDDENSQALVDPNEANTANVSYFHDPYAYDNFRKNIPIKAKLSGYVQYSSWWDTRQICGLGAGYAALYPRKKELDPIGNDTNAHGDFNMGILETRAKLELFGPKILGAESFAYLESDIFGVEGAINRWRIRHSFLQLTWKNVQLLLGQFWHPMFVIDAFPLPVSFNGGAPIEPFSRNPQIRITATNKQGLEAVISASSQLEFTSNGPIGFSSTYIRNSSIPELTLRIAQRSKHNYGGFGIDVMRIKPRLKSDLTGYKVHESLNSVRCFIFDTIKIEPLEIRTQLTYAQNGTNLALLGGYAVSSINPTTDERTYSNLSVINYWVDININRKTEPGIFIGITKNLGSSHNIIQCFRSPVTGIEETTIYTLPCFGEQIDTVFRVAPRIRFHVRPIEIATEIEYTRAGYGCITNCGQVKQVDPIANTRLLFTAYYYF